ncbi:MAG TPA: hypothetical protein VH477_16195 [Bryobacteraceae bacterium]|jgi:hypothetical protein
MPCLLALLSVAFPRVAIVLLWLLTSFFNVLHSNIIVPILGFLFLPLTLIVYTYLLRAYGGHFGVTQLVFLFIAVIVDLGLIGGGLRGRG